MSRKPWEVDCSASEPLSTSALPQNVLNRFPTRRDERLHSLTTGCLLPTFVCVLGSLSRMGSSPLASPGTEKRVPEVWKGIRSSQMSFFFFNMLTMIRPLKRFSFPSCLTFKMPPALSPMEKKCQREAKDQDVTGWLVSRQKQDWRVELGSGKTPKEGRVTEGRDRTFGTCFSHATLWGMCHLTAGFELLRLLQANGSHGHQRKISSG